MSRKMKITVKNGLKIEFEGSTSPKTRFLGYFYARQPAASATLAAGWRGSAFVNACGEGKVPCLERGGKGKARAGAELRRGARL